MPADLLTVLRQADEVYCEVPFCQKCGSEIVHGVIDLLYRCGDAWRIIDYKTNAERTQLAERYAPSLSHTGTRSGRSSVQRQRRGFIILTYEHHLWIVHEST